MKTSRFAHKIEHCEQCGAAAPKTGEPGNHDSNISTATITWEGVVIVAWCYRCGWEYCS